MLGLSPREARRRVDDRDRLRRARPVHRPQAQELLVGHARPARVRGDDPGRRRHPADRRGARRRRRRVPAEVLRRVRRASARRARRSCSSPTTWAPCTASATARCCSSGAAWSPIGDPDDVGNRYLELNFSEAARNDAAKEQTSARRSASATARAEILDAWFEDEAGERTGTVPSAAGARRSPPACASTPTSDDPLFGVVLQNDQQGDRARGLEPVVEPDARAASRPGRRSSTACASTTCSSPGRYHATPAVARQGGGIAWIDRRERMLSLLVSGHAAHRRDRRPALRGRVIARRARASEVPS